MKQGLFITGSDTGVGKTTIAKILITYYQRFYQVKVRKPVESGCRKISGELLPDDAVALLLAAGENESLSVVCPYRFSAIASPELAAETVGEVVGLAQLLDACSVDIEADDFVIIEGAGGLCSPMAKDVLNLDLASALNLPIVIVVRDELGGVNQALLTIKVAKQQELDIAFVVLNQQKSVQDHYLDLNNKVAIEKYSKIPVCVYSGDVSDFTQQLSKL